MGQWRGDGVGEGGEDLLKQQKLQKSIFVRLKTSKEPSWGQRT